jgi:hypothetical protein
VSLEDKRKMMHMLQKFEEQSLQHDDQVLQGYDSHEDEDILLTQLARLPIDGKQDQLWCLNNFIQEISLDMLTKEQQEKFKRDVAKGVIKVELWKPWWTVITQVVIIFRNILTSLQ